MAVAPSEHLEFEQYTTNTPILFPNEDSGGTCRSIVLPSNGTQMAPGMCPAVYRRLARTSIIATFGSWRRRRSCSIDTATRDFGCSSTFGCCEPLLSEALKTASPMTAVKQTHRTKSLISLIFVIAISGPRATTPRNNLLQRTSSCALIYLRRRDQS